MFGPDNRLYVAEYPGTIKIFTIQRNGPTDYEVIGVESLTGVSSIVNHNDDGQPCGGALAADCNKRETTGLTVGGTAANPVIYVSSSDFRIGAGSSGNGDTGLDTNSGVITRLSWNGSSWDVVDLVRGLPRSEENHATNGLELATINGTEYLIVAQGGNTNGGAPSTSFVYTGEYALSAAVLSIDLDAINALPILTDGNGRDYVYDLPTLDDPTRANANGIIDPDAPGYDGIDVNDPWGGNDGLNQAMVVPGGPVQILSPGYRNAYDLVVTESGALYVTDNGANQGWGGFPPNEGTANVTNDYDPNEPGSSSSSGGEAINNEDHLELVTNDLQSYTFGSFYGGHPNPTRANPTGAGLYTDNGTSQVFRTLIYDPVNPGPGYTDDPNIALPANWPPVATGNAVEGDWRGPGINNPDGPDDNPVTIWGTNTNGIDEYTASNFGGAMKGNLLAGTNTGLIRRVELNPDGSLDQLTPNFLSGIGGSQGNALGISANGDSEIFPGTIWAGTLNGLIVVFEPQDFVNCIDPSDPEFEPSADYDADGYSNQDELDNGTDPCNGGSQPNDFDKSAGAPLISDLNDLDDDNDGILDQDDPFQLGNPDVSGSDAFTLPVYNDLFNDQQGLGGIFGLGMTGLMNNGDPNPNYLNWLDRRDDPSDPNPNDVLGGAPGLMTSHMTSGTANGATNTQEKGYQYGVQVDQTTGIFTVMGNLVNLVGPLRIYGNTAATGGELGHFIGDGTQSNFIKMVLTADGITALQEIDDTPQTPIFVPIDVANRPSTSVFFYFVVDASTGEVTLQYELDGNGRITAGTITAEGSILDAIQQSNQDLAVGFIGTSNTTGVELEGTWDVLHVVGQVPTIAQAIPDITRIINSGDEDIDLDVFFADDNGDENLTYTVESNTGPTVGTSINGNILTLSYPGTTTSSDITIRATDNDAFFVEQTFTVTVTDSPVVLYRVNTGGPELTAIDGDLNWEADQIGNNSAYLVQAGSNNVYTSTTMSVDGSVNQTTTPLAIYATERYDSAAGAPELTYSFPVVQSGNYEVRLYMGNSFSGTSNPDERIFDVELEGLVLPLLNNIDLSGTYGHEVGTVITHTIKVTDGTLDISFIHGPVNNPLINAIEILDAIDNETPIYVDPIADQLGNTGQQLNGSLVVSAYGGDGNLTYAATGLPDGLTIEPTNGQIGGTIASTAALGSPYNVTITVNDSDGLTSDEVQIDFVWEVVEPFSFRINAGGNSIATSDIGPNWEDNGDDGLQIGGNYSVNTGLVLSSTGMTFATKDSSIPAYIDEVTFENIFGTERYDLSSGPEMEYSISLDNGDYVVNLYLGNNFDGTDTVGDRIFDILLEGVAVEENFDIIERFGHQVAGMLSYPVTVSDGELNISFGHVTQNPLVNAIEVFIENTSNPLVLNGIADQNNEIANNVTLQASASGGDLSEDFTYYISGQPDGININSVTGEITGTIAVSSATGGPNNNGVHSVVVTAMKPNSAPVSQTFTWTIDTQFIWTLVNEDQNYTPRHENSFVQAGDKFYLMGGRENATSIDVYDYTNDSWVELTDVTPIVEGVQVEFNHFQATEYNGLIWVIGAFKTNNFPNEVPAESIWIFDPSTNEWIQGPDIPQNRRRGSTGLVVYNDKFYVVGGNTDGHDGGYVAWFDEYDPATGNWTVLTDAPRARDHFAATIIGDKMYVVGGRLSGGAGGVFAPTIPEVDVYDFNTETWSTLPSDQNIPTPRGGASVANFNNKLVVIGGEVMNQEVYGVVTDDALKVTEEYDPALNSWKRLPDLNFERHGTQAIVSGPGIHILAGSPVRGGGNQKNMEYLGEYAPVGTPSAASTLIAPNTVVVGDQETVDIDLSVIDGNVGIFVKSMEITGADAADFSIVTGELSNGLIGVNGSHTLSVTLSGTGADRTAILTVHYGNSETLSIALTNNPDAVFSVSNPGDQYNYEGDVVSLQIEATSPNISTYSATGLPPNLSIDANTGVISGTIDDGAGSGGSDAYVEENGLVIIEAENLNINSNWSIETSESGYSGSGYLYNHVDSFNTPGNGVITAEIEITTPGKYRFQWRNNIGIIDPDDPTTEHNDAWLRFPDADAFYGQSGGSFVYPHGSGDFPNPNGAGANNWFKVYANTLAWNWTSNVSDNDPHQVYVEFNNPGTYTMEISSRSEGHLIDRIALHLVSEGYTTGDLDSAPESSQGNGGPGAAANSPYNVSVNVTDNGDPAGNETIDFVWYVGQSGELIAVPQADVTTGVVPLTVNFTGSNSLDDIGVTSYSWDFKDGPGSTSTQADPTYEFTEIGTYIVDLTVEDIDGNIDTKSITINVTGSGIAPIAVASSDVTEGFVPLDVVFNGSASSDDLGIASYAWDFGDGVGASTEMNPTYTYPNVGIYTAILTVTDIEGLTATDQISITVQQPNEAPVAVVSADQEYGDAPLEVSFVGSNSTDDVGIVDYAWDFGNGNTSTEANPVYVFNVSGNYTVVLTVTDGGGLMDTAEIIISVGNPAPVAVATATPETGEAPLNVSFTGSNSTDNGTIVSYAWDFGDGTGTSTLADPTYTYSDPGNYIAVLTVTDNEGESTTANVLITVAEVGGNLAPVAVATATPETGDAPLQVTFTGSNSTDDGTIVSYAWDFGDGNSSTEADPTHNYMNSGNFTAILTVTDNQGLSSTANIMIQVTEAGGNLAPVAVATATPETGDAPLQVTFIGSNSTDDGTIVSYAWDFGDGNSSTEADPTHTYMNSGSFTAILTVTDDQGLSSTASVLIQVTEVGGNQAPVAIAAANPTQGEAPLPVMFNASGSTDDVGIVSYFWDFGDGRTSTIENPVLTFDAAGTYMVTLTVTDEDGLIGTDTVTIIVGAANLQAPTAVISATPQSGNGPLEVSFTGSNSTDDVAVVSYAWDFGDGNMSNEADPIHTYNNSGIYNVELTVTDADGLSDTETITIEVFQEETGDIVGVIAPNPAPDLDGFANIQLSQIPSNTVLTYIHLHDSTGKLVGTFNAAQAYDMTRDAYRVSVSALRNGLYYVTIERDNGDPIELKVLVNN
ncbi:PKD domain-containing protein [Flagellimonas sp. GZD32]|uniref:PKD domain-containing protein n=1 Tax=Flagellimonas cixiensis TaxID=3228750 RepID=UPI0035C8D4EC